MEGREAIATTTTTADGLFRFESVRIGRYQLVATKPGFLKAGFGAKWPGGIDMTVVVADGERLDALVIAMWRSAIVTGTIRNQDAQGIPGVMVQLVRATPRSVGGGTSASPAQVTETNDLGEYRFFDVPPGDYLIVAAARRIRTLGTAARSGSAGQSGETWPPAFTIIYYPGSPRLEDATALRVESGREVTAVDFQYLSVPSTVVSGVVHVSTGEPPELFTFSGDIITDGWGRPLKFDPNGQFSVAVPQGTYALTVCIERIRHGANRTDEPDGFSRPLTLWARTQLAVGESAIRDLVLTGEPGVEIMGQVVFDQTPSSAFAVWPVKALLASIRPTVNQAHVDIGSALDKSGRFHVRDVAPGTYRLVVDISGASKDGWVVETVTLNGQRVPESAIEFTASRRASTLAIRMTPQSSDIAGVLLDSGGRPAVSHYLLIFPGYKAAWGLGHKRVRLVHPATDGTFTISNLPAGDYFIALIDDSKPIDLSDLRLFEWLMSFRPFRVTLRTAEHRRLVLKVPGPR